MAQLLEVLGCIDGIVGFEGVAVGPSVHVLADAVVVDDACYF